jgi:hypothetical protein
MNDPFAVLLEKTKREIVGMSALQERIEKKKLDARKGLRKLSDMAVNLGISGGAAIGLVHEIENRSLPDEIRSILGANYPDWMTPKIIRSHLDQLGWDLTNASNNPQSAIHMALKRMSRSSSDPTEEQTDSGRKSYRCAPMSYSLGAAFGVAVTAAGKEANRLLKQMADEIKK